MDPFLSPDDFAARFPRPLTSAEALVAKDLLVVISNWIYVQLPLIPFDDPGARTVVFEVVRDEIMYGPVSKLDSFQNSTLHRTEMGRLSADQVNDLITPRHARMLGISLKSAPVATFMCNDWGLPELAPGVGGSWGSNTWGNPWGEYD